MTRQKNVQQQNALTSEEIRKAARLFQDADRHVAWLGAAVQAQGEVKASGLLVAFRTVPDQSGGAWVKGIWLTNERRFWEFEAVVPRQEGESVEIERLEDMTDSVAVSAHVPGTAKTFGYLALEVLDAQPTSDRGDV